MNQNNLSAPDWSKIPAPKEDEDLSHLLKYKIKSVLLKSTNNQSIDLSKIKGLSIIYIYPMTGQPNKPLPENWDNIPGARGCTPQSCSFRDNFSILKNLNVNNIFGLSTQTTDYQKEMTERLHLPFPVLSDEKLEERIDDAIEYGHHRNLTDRELLDEVKHDVNQEIKMNSSK